METTELAKSLIIVAPDHRHQWLVVEVGLDLPLSQFEEKDEAIDYAVKIGRMRFNSQVKVYNDSGVTEAEFMFMGYPHIA